MNQNPGWKYLLLVLIIVPAFLYALPNVFGEDPGVQIAGIRGTEVTQSTLNSVTNLVRDADIEPIASSLDRDGVRLRFANTGDQLKARELIAANLGNSYSVALGLMPAMPDWLASIGAAPMYLGLDLRGGVHFLLQVDIDAAQTRATASYVEDIRNLLREENIRHRGVRLLADSTIQVRFADPETRTQGFDQIVRNFIDLTGVVNDGAEFPELLLTVSAARLKEVGDSSLQQNITALRSRIDELGVSEPVLQRQGADRIVVQLPGVQDTARAKDILGRTATLEVMLVDEDNAVGSAVRGVAPAGSKIFRFRDGTPILLKRQLLYSGENIIDAGSGFDNLSGGPVVNITLDSRGSAINSRITSANIGNRMAILYVENRRDLKLDAAGNPVLDDQGREVYVPKRIEEVITAPVIRDQLGRRFQISGLDSNAEAQDLALLLRAGSLATPVFIVEERTVGPSLGKDNIDKGFKSVLGGLLAVLVFMGLYYRVFGLVACTALTLNLVIIVAVLSLFQATLTLPGVAGMVLTVGMAVDANVLIFERIREELRKNSSPQVSIHRGYEQAFSTIVDANVTTLIAALVLFNFGTGPIKGFAITLSIGILTSMVTAIFMTRILVNLIYGKRRVEKLAI
ncbi:MAG: protein translocase subunit SecD [Proteobacteria bacterium]|jgi:preprotein translocase subunit SecD|nr:protein translocase subunit SecD [Pseudomonadota bacterium]